MIQIKRNNIHRKEKERGDRKCGDISTHRIHTQRIVPNPQGQTIDLITKNKFFSLFLAS